MYYKMETFCSVCLLVTVFVCLQTTSASNSGGINDAADDALAKLLQRIEYLEERDLLHEELYRQQQRDIDALRADVQTLNKENIAKDETILKQHQELLTLTRVLSDKDRDKTVTDDDLQGGARRREGRSENDNPVAFYTRLSSVLSHIGSNQVIAFDRVITNVGGSYNSTHGIFTAPVPGIYVFSTTIMAEGVTDTHVGIFVNGQVTTWLKLFGTEHQYDTMSQTAVLELKQNDVVSVQHTESDKTLHGLYCYFSGFLLQQLHPQSGIVG